MSRRNNCELGCLEVLNEYLSTNSQRTTTRSGHERAPDGPDAQRVQRASSRKNLLLQFDR